jgi:hypothetical protein
MSLQLEALWLLGVGLATRRLLPRLPLFVSAKLLGLGMGAVQLLPSFDYLQYTVRAETNEAFRATYSLPPANLLQLVAPYLYREGYFRAAGEPANAHEFAAYAGAATLVLALFGLARGAASRERRGLVLGLGAALVLGLDLALGKYGLLYGLQLKLPVLGLFRAPARNLLVAHLALAGLAAVGFDALRAARGAAAPLPWRRLWPLGLGVLAATLAALAMALARAGPGAGSAFALQGHGAAWLGAGLLLVAGAAALAALAARGARLALVALVLLAAADLAVYGLRYAWSQPPLPWTALRARPAALPPPVPGTRIHGGFTDFAARTPNGFALRGYHLVNGYAGAARLEHLDYRTLPALRMAGVVWLWRNDLEPPRAEPLEGALPRARLVTRAVVTPRPRAALRGIDPATTALVFDPVQLAGGAPGRARILVDEPGHVVVRTETPGAQLLVLAEKHLPDWRVAVDGRAARLLAVYGDFMGAIVPEGRHEVVFRFDPPALRTGRRVSLASLAGALLLLGAPGLRAGHRARPSRGGAAESIY